MKKSKTAVKSQPLGKKKDTRGIKYFLWILPFLILVFLFSYFPLHGWIYSFYDYRPPRSLADCEFVGLQWFKMLFTNKTQVSQLIQVMKNTFVMRLLGIATSILPVGFAIFLNEIKCKWFKTFVQTFTTLPNFISWVLVYSVAFSLFSSTGMINSLLENLGIITEPIKFLDSDSHTYLWMLLWNIWKGLGWGAIMYLASIAGIDQEQYEAAEIDGAGIFKVFYTDFGNGIHFLCSWSVEQLSRYIDLCNRTKIVFSTVFTVYLYQSGKFSCGDGEKLRNSSNKFCGACDTADRDIYSYDSICQWYTFCVKIYS